MSRLVCLITGGSSGIGKCTAEALCAQGHKVYELSRRAQGPWGVTHISADITDEAQVRRAVADILRQEQRIDILINNAGFGISGAAEFTSSEAAQRQLAVNFFGMAALCREVVPLMRSSGGGRIVNVSSVAGLIPIPFQAFYSASKAAVNAFSLALANEVKPFGIRVCTVLPGDIQTGFTAAREKSALGNEAYAGRIDRSVGKMEQDERHGMAPVRIGSLIARIALSKGNKPAHVLGLRYKLLTLLYRLLPLRLANGLVGLLYAR